MIVSIKDVLENVFLERPFQKQKKLFQKNLLWKHVHNLNGKHWSLLAWRVRGRERDLYAGTFDGCKKKTSLGEGEKKWKNGIYCQKKRRTKLEGKNEQVFV